MENGGVRKRFRKVLLGSGRTNLHGHVDKSLHVSCAHVALLQHPVQASSTHKVGDNAQACRVLEARDAQQRHNVWVVANSMHGVQLLQHIKSGLARSILGHAALWRKVEGGTCGEGQFESLPLMAAVVVTRYLEDLYGNRGTPPCTLVHIAWREVVLCECGGRGTHV